MFSTDKSAFDIPGHADIFEKYRVLGPSQIDKWINFVLDLVSSQVSNDKIILDAGAGTGRFSMPIAGAVADLGYTVYALERSKEMLNSLIHNSDKLKIENIKLINADIVNYKPIEKFAGIFISEVLHLLDNYEIITNSLYNLLEETGWLIIRTPSHHQLEKIEWLKFFPNALEYDISRTRDIADINNALKSAGFSKVHIYNVNESIQMPTSIYINMLKQKAYSILYSFSSKDLEIGYKLLNEYSKEKSTCPHTMELTCIIAFK